MKTGTLEEIQTFLLGFLVGYIFTVCVFSIDDKVKIMLILFGFIHIVGVVNLVGVVCGD